MDPSLTGYIVGGENISNLPSRKRRRQMLVSLLIHSFLSSYPTHLIYLNVTLYETLYVILGNIFIRMVFYCLELRQGIMIDTLAW